MDAGQVMRMQLQRVHSLTLIERAARNAREALCEASELAGLAAAASDLVEANPAVLMRLNGGVSGGNGPVMRGSARSEKQRLLEASNREASRSEFEIRNAVAVAVQLGRAMGMIGGEGGGGGEEVAQG